MPALLSYRRTAMATKDGGRVLRPPCWMPLGRLAYLGYHKAKSEKVTASGAVDSALAYRP